MTTQGVDRVNNLSKTQQKTETSKVSQIVVKNGDTVSGLAKKFGMSSEEFIQWAGLKNSKIKIGQKIDLPMDTVPKGKGILALARKYNMTLEEFGKLNNLPKPYNEYSATKGEMFYVKTAASHKPQDKNNSNNPAAENLKKWGSQYSPKEIATKLEKEAYDKWGAVGKKSFDDMLNEINPQNASAVIKSYDNADYGQSLINRITHEVTSNEGARKKAVMQIYDALAAEKNTPKSVREEFEKELNDRFDDWGMVDTEKLDEIINKIISGEIKNEKISGQSKPRISNNNSPVKLTRNSGEFTVSSLQKGAIHSAKNEAKDNFKLFCKENNIPYDENKLDLAPLDRIPAPTVKGKSIVANETELLKPTTKPNGKVVILNPGHGGYSARTGYFDPGSYSFIKKGNGMYAPLLEYEKMKGYSESLSEELRAQGYAVVITSAHAQTLSDQQSISKLVKNLQNGEKGNIKYDKNNIMFISLHADSEPGKSGSGVCYDSRFEQDSNLTNILIKNLNQDDWIKADSSQRNWNVPRKGLQVLHQTENIPSVLVEVEYVNGSKSKNLDSSAFQNRFENKLLDGINEYFNE